MLFKNVQLVLRLYFLSQIEVKLTHSTGPQIIFFVKFFQVHSVNNMWSKGMLLCILIVYCNAVANEETSRFLKENGFGNLEPTFLVEEIEVRQIPRMPDNLLVALGVRTIGSRLRIRSAAGQWVQAQVCVVNL